MKRESEAALAGMMKPMKREDVTDLIVFRKMKTGIKWPQIAKAVGQSKEWTAAACLGQMQMSAKQAQAVGKLFDLPDEAVLLLQQVPYKGSLPTAVPTDPLIYRFYELVNVYGSTFKALIHEEFGDGIMSAIDFDLDLARLPHEKGDRVKIVMRGKYLPYKTDYALGLSPDAQAAHASATSPRTFSSDLPELLRTGKPWSAPSSQCIVHRSVKRPTTPSIQSRR